MSGVTFYAPSRLWDTYYVGRLSSATDAIDPSVIRTHHPLKIEKEGVRIQNKLHPWTDAGTEGGNFTAYADLYFPAPNVDDLILKRAQFVFYEKGDWTRLWTDRHPSLAFYKGRAPLSSNYRFTILTLIFLGITTGALVVYFTHVPNFPTLREE